jgi:hypothetical protein
MLKQIWELKKMGFGLASGWSWGVLEATEWLGRFGLVSVDC